MRKQFQSESYTLFINDVRRLQSRKGLHSLPLHAAATHRIHDNTRRRALTSLLLLTHLSQQHIKHTRWPSLILLLQWPDLPHPHASVAMWKSFVRDPVFSPGNTFNYSPLLGSQCTRQSWQVFLPVDMCRVGGQDLNGVSSAIPDSRYFAPTTVSKSTYFIGALPKTVTCRHSVLWKKQQYAASGAIPRCIMTPTDSLCEQPWHIGRIIRNMQEASSLFDTGMANVMMYANIFTTLFSVFHHLDVFLKFDTRRQVFTLPWQTKTCKRYNKKHVLSQGAKSQLTAGWNSALNLLFSVSFPNRFVDSTVSKSSIPCSNCAVINFTPLKWKNTEKSKPPTPYLLTFIEKYPTVHKSSSPSRLCLTHTSLEMNPLNPSLSFPPSVGKQLSWNSLKPTHTHTYIISVIRSLCISSNLMSVLALKVMNVAYGCLRASGGCVWKITNVSRGASLASRASALSSVKPLAKTHSEIMGAVR